MAKSSRSETEKHRREIIGAASRLLREQGDSAMSVQKVMGEVGLTHGGFYKHFSSKDQLMNLAAEEAFSELIGIMQDVLESSTNKNDAWDNLVRAYLSPEHREDRAGGCANTALATESARAGDGSGIRNAYIHGLTQTLEALKPYQDEASTAESEQERLQSLLILVGALTLSRATAGTELSDRVSSAAKALLLSS